MVGRKRLDLRKTVRLTTVIGLFTSAMCAYGEESTAQHIYRINLPKVLTPQINTQRPPPKINSKTIQSAYISAGSPTIALYWMHEFSDALSRFQYRSTTDSDREGADIKLQNIFEAELIRMGLTIIDRKTTVRLANISNQDTEVSNNGQLVEALALKNFADRLLQVTFINLDNPEDSFFSLRYIDTATGALVKALTVPVKDLRGKSRRSMIATDKGYQEQITFPPYTLPDIGVRLVNQMLTELYDSEY